MGALSVTANAHYRDPFGPLIPGVTFIAPGDVKRLRQAAARSRPRRRQTVRPGASPPTQRTAPRRRVRAEESHARSGGRASHAPRPPVRSAPAAVQPPRNCPSGQATPRSMARRHWAEPVRTPSAATRCWCARGSRHAAGQRAHRRHRAHAEQSLELLMQHPGARQFVARGAIVRVLHHGVRGVRDGMPGEQHVAAPLQVLGDWRRLKRRGLPHRAPHRGAHVVEGAVRQPIGRRQPRERLRVQRLVREVVCEATHLDSWSRVTALAPGVGTCRAKTPATRSSWRRGASK